MTPLSAAPAAVATALARVGGIGLALTFAGLGRLRQARPLHPTGVVAEARLRVNGQGTTGIAAFDTPGEVTCTARLSRAIGRPTGSADIAGLALRVPGAGPDGAHADLLLAATGSGPVSRHFLAIRRRIGDGPLTTLWPYRTTTGSTMLAARPLTHVDEADPSDSRWSLEAAHGRGPWTRIAGLTIAGPVPDPPVRFDTVENPFADVRQYPWVEALRLGAYSGARAGWSPRRGDHRAGRRPVRLPRWAGRSAAT